MADLILECPRAGPASTDEDLVRVAALLHPSNIVSPHPTRVIDECDLRVAIVNPGDEGVRTEEGGVLLGGVIGEAGHWSAIGSDPPDGTYAIARYSAANIELVSDIVASRTLWYSCDDECFRASTSQRALVALLGDFDLNEEAVAWMMSAGSLGPEASWDARIRCLPDDATLHLDRRTWRLTLDQHPVEFEPARRTRREHLGLLHEALLWSCGSLDIDTDRWLLPLSGGVDSRAILAMMVRSARRPKCVTWTTPASVKKPLSDAFIAPLVARRWGVAHEFFYLEDSRTDPAAALQRFVTIGEGRTDHFSGYTDGGVMWGDVFASGACGVIRGDESFGGGRLAASTDAARRGAGGTMATDYPEGHLVRRLGLVDVEWPERLRRRPGERSQSYYDRLEQQYELPSVLAALNELKARYVEVVNPLLSRRLIHLVRSFPDEIRMYGRAYLDVVDRESGPIPHARFSSVQEVSTLLQNEDLLKTICVELTSPRMAGILDEEGIVRLLVAMASSADGDSDGALRSFATAGMKAASLTLPARVAARLTPPYEGPDDLPAVLLGLRATIAGKTVALLRGDAAALSGGTVAARQRRHQYMAL